MDNDRSCLASARVSADAFAALNAQAAALGISRSDLLRAAIAASLMSPDDVAAAADLGRQRARAVAMLGDAVTLLNKLGGLYAYALKAHRPVEAEEAAERLRAIRTMRSAARELLAR